jgi:hypothetical protein
MSSAGTQANPLAPFWLWLSRQGPPWWNHGVMFGGPSQVRTIDSVRWRITFNVHATRRSRRAKPYPTAGLSIVPAKVKDMEKGRIRRGRWVRVVGHEIKRHGYSGGWRDSRWGGAAMWFKELPTLEAMQAEVKQIPEYDVAGWLRGWAGPSNKRMQLTRSANAKRRGPRS